MKWILFVPKLVASLLAIAVLPFFIILVWLVGAIFNESGAKFLDTLFYGPGESLLIVLELWGKVLNRTERLALVCAAIYWPLVVVGIFLLATT